MKSSYFRIKGKYLFDTGESSEALDHYYKCWDIVRDNQIPNEESTILQEIGLYFSEHRDFASAFVYFRDSLKIREKHNFQPFIASSLHDYGNAFQSMGETDKALKYFNRALAIFVELELKTSIARVYNDIGYAHQNLGHLDDALLHYETSLKISQELQDKSRIANAYNSIGIFYVYKGELDKALEYQYKSLHINESIKNEIASAGNYNNIGLILQQKGDLSQSLQFHLKHLQTAEKFDRKTDLATAYVNLGSVYHIQGDLDLAEENFMKCLEIDKATGNDIEIAETLYNLLRVNIEKDKMEQAQEYLNELKRLNQTGPNKIVSLRARLATAILLKEGDRTVNRAKAQEILTEIANEEILEHELTVHAKLSLSELLLIELKNTGNEEVLSEFKTIVEDLTYFAQDQNSWKLLAETYLLQSRFAILELNLEEAQRLINQAQIIADTNGLTNLARKISQQFDRLNDQQSSLERLVKQEATLLEKIDEINLEETLNRMINKRPDEVDMVPEVPAMLLVLDTSGIQLYTKKFDQGSQVKEDLIGGLLTAVHTLSEDVFATSGSIQRIRHNEFTVVLKPVDSVLFCYVFTGQSYLALQRLDKLIHLLRGSKTIWDAFQRDIPGLTKSEKDGMRIIVNDVFAT
jgi:tetratricopeptide (TPR) repeat protein